MTLTNQSIGEFAVLTVTSVVLLGVSTALLLNFRGVLTRYAHYVWSFYQRPRWRWMHPGTEKRDRIGIRLASAVGLAMGSFIFGVEMAALASGHVA